MMHELRRYFESLMGIEPVAAGEDTHWHLRFSIGWPDWVLLLFSAFAIAFVVSIYLREGSRATRSYRLFLAGIRITLIALVVVMLSGLEISIDRTGLPYLVVMVDESESMAVRDRNQPAPANSATNAASGSAESDRSASAASPGLAAEADRKTRLERVKQWFKLHQRQMGELFGEHKLQVYAFSKTPRLVGTYLGEGELDKLQEDLASLDSKGTESRIGSSLRGVLNNLRGTPPSSVILFTDGVTTDGEPLPQAARYASRKNTPVFTVGVGDPERFRDLDLHDLLVDDTVFIDDIVSLEAKLTPQGFEGEEVEVMLKEKGSSAPFDTKRVRLGPDGRPIKVRLAHRPTRPGTIEYEIEVEPLEQEAVVTNNLIKRDVRVVDEKIRVLYVEGYPRYEFRFLKHLLEREATVALTTLLLDADPEYVQQDRTAMGYFPASKQELFEHDVVILGDVAPALFSPSQLQNLRDFVRIKGGGLLFIAGREAMPRAYRDTVMADLLPIEVGPSGRGLEGDLTQGFQPQLTIEGGASPLFRFAVDEEENRAIWESLPNLYWFAGIEKAKPGAQTLVEHPLLTEGGQHPPLVVTQFFGSGRTYFQGFDSTWRWRFRTEDLFHSRYWIQAIRYLSRSKLLGKNRTVELLLDRQKYRRGDPVQIRVRFLDETQVPIADDGVSVAIERPGQPPQNVTLRRAAGHRSVFEGIFVRSDDGSYQVRVTTPVGEGNPATAEFLVEPPPGELDRIQMQESTLKEVANITDGRYYAIDAASPLFDQLPAGRKVVLHTDPPFPLWNTWPVLTLFVTLLLLEWILRKRKQML